METAPLIADGKWHTATVTTRTLADPESRFNGGPVTRLRLDPTDSAGGEIEISEIRFGSQKIPDTGWELDAPEWQKEKTEFLLPEKTVVTCAHF